MLGDLLVLTVLLNLTGGIENPLHFLYVIHVVIASLLFKGREIFQIAWLAIALFTGEAVGEYVGWLPHHHIPSASVAAHDLPYLLMTLSSFWLVMLFSAYIGARIMRHNRTIKDELVSRQEELVAADQAKMDFFRFVTHEVKSPVSTAQSAVETALELGGGPDVAAGGGHARTGRQPSGSGLGEMVRDLADLTRSGCGPAGTCGRWTSGIATARPTSSGTSPPVAVRRSGWRGRRHPGDHLQRGHAGKVVTNLVSNAVRYNREGGCVRMRTGGIGAIRPADGCRRGHRHRSGRARTHLRGILPCPGGAGRVPNLGTGFGLPIVKRFVTDLGGSRGRATAGPARGRSSRWTLPRPAGRRRRRGEEGKPRERESGRSAAAD